MSADPDANVVTAGTWPGFSSAQICMGRFPCVSLAGLRKTASPAVEARRKVGDNTG